MLNNITDTWLTPKKAIQELHRRNCKTMIGEKTLRNLIKQGFPCISIGNRNYINIDTFNDDLKLFSKKNRNIYPIKASTNNKKNKSFAQKKYSYNNGAIRTININ